MLGLPNFGYITISAIQLVSRDKLLLVTSRTRNYDVKNLFYNRVILRRLEVANFSYIIKISITLINF